MMQVGATALQFQLPKVWAGFTEGLARVYAHSYVRARGLEKSEFLTRREGVVASFCLALRLAINGRGREENQGKLHLPLHT
jgi:hypothetical protein